MQMKLAQDCWREAEANIRNINTNKICTFGIKPLDDALLGLFNNDFFVIGADSGVGKSQMGLDIAVHNAKNGKKVALYYIEGGAEEAINRIRWKLMLNRYYKNQYYTDGKIIDLDYRKWRLGLLNNETLKKLNDDCYVEFNDLVKDNLHIYSFEEGFTIKMLIDSIGYFTDVRPGMFLPETFLDIDLLIIDHLQYFTLTNPKNELTEMTEILMKVKDITNFHKIPVIMVSHLRKKEKDRGLPSQEDFYGTSNIAKIASQAIAICPYFSADNHVNDIYPTFFRFIKSRTGIRQSLAVLCDFNVKKGQYEDEYKVYKLIGDKPEANPIENFHLPKWAYKPKEIK